MNMLSEPPYRWFDHTADVGMEVRGASLAELFENAARGLYDYLGAPMAVDRPLAEELRLRAPDEEELLVSWLGELLYRLTSQGRWYERIALSVAREQGGISLAARLKGGFLPEGARRGSREVKAVTYSDLLIEETAEGWRARVVLDV